MGDPRVGGAPAHHRDPEEWRRLAELVLRLTAVTSLGALVEVVTGYGTAVLAAAGCAIVVRADDGGWRLIGSNLEVRLQARYAYEPFDSPMPGCRAVRERRRFLLPDRDSARRLHPAMEEAVDLTGRSRWAVLPLVCGERAVGSLVVSWVRPEPFDDDLLDLLDVFAAHCAPTVERLTAAREQRLLERRQRHVAQAVRRMSDELQRTALPHLPSYGQVRLGVSYRPASPSVEIGGDWYDAFVNRRGELVLVLGDVSGHDHVAAAAMSQVRAYLRGLSWGSELSPAGQLQLLDEVVVALQPGCIASVVLAVVRADAVGEHVMCWASAGHPSPLLRHPDGRVDLLHDGAGGGATRLAGRVVGSDVLAVLDEGTDEDRDLVLGVDPATPRHDHEVLLAADSVVLLYTDGVVEDRAADFDTGLRQLAGTFRNLSLEDLHRACERLLGAGATPVGEAGHPAGGAGADDRTVVLVSTVRTPALATDTAGATGSVSEPAPPPRRALGTVSRTRTIALPADPVSVSRARRVVGSVCTTGGWSSEETDTAALLVSELVTNAIVHARGESVLTVTSSTERLLVEVEDEGGSVPRVVAEEPEALSGRGLRPVERAADQWGVHLGRARRAEGGTGGKTVWFALQRTP